MPFTLQRYIVKNTLLHTAFSAILLQAVNIILSLSFQRYYYNPDFTKNVIPIFFLRHYTPILPQIQKKCDPELPRYVKNDNTDRCILKLYVLGIVWISFFLCFLCVFFSPTGFRNSVYFLNTLTKNSWLEKRALFSFFSRTQLKTSFQENK